MGRIVKPGSWMSVRYIMAKLNHSSPVVWNRLLHHLLVVQTRLIPMMAVGDERPAVRHGLSNR